MISGALYCDHDSDALALAEQLRRRGIEVVTAREVGNEELSDAEQLAYATRLGWPIYTANRADYARLHTEWAHARRSHGGIIIRARQTRDIGTQLRALLALFDSHREAGFRDLILYV